jgi:hypothetical protein
MNSRIVPADRVGHVEVKRVDSKSERPGSAFLDNGEVISGVGQGTYESKGKHRWATANTWELSDAAESAIPVS